MLGLANFSFFIGESIFFFYLDAYNTYDYAIIAELFFMFATPFILAHIIINIRYFAEKIEDYQKILLIIIPTVIIIGYSLFVNINPPDDSSDFYFGLLFVSKSSVILGFTVMAFTIFRQTALFAPWFLLLIGIFVGTVGEIVFRYSYTLGFYDFGNASTSLWLASSMILIYALYKHQKSI